MFFKKYLKTGIILISNQKNDLGKINRRKVIDLFKESGCIIFRGFNTTPKNLLKFTNKFTIRYANDANRRDIIYGKKIKTVDEGTMEMPLHSEASYSPSWPEIVWFYCAKPPQKSGWTTVCDGKKIYQQLSADSKKFFLANPITYKMKIPYGRGGIKLKKMKIRDWFVDAIGIKKSKIDMNNQNVFIELERYGVTQINNEHAFSNHLQIIMDRDPQLLSWKINKKTKLPKKILEELKKICKKNIYEIKWKKNDFCMIDNRRFMHGRTKINLKDKSREIFNIQTLVSNCR